MKVKIYILVFFYLFTALGHTQSSKKKLLFSEVIQLKAKDLSQITNQIKQEPENGTHIFNNFTRNNLTNSYFDNFKAKNLNGALITINKYFKKPTILNTFASWHIIEDGNISEINNQAKKHHEKIDFVVLFWDPLTKVRKKARLFNKYVTVLYIDERENIFPNEIYHLKYTLGQSLVYYIDPKDLIINITKNPHYTRNTYKKEQLITHHYLSKEIDLFLVKTEVMTNNVAKD